MKKKAKLGAARAIDAKGTGKIPNHKPHISNRPHMKKVPVTAGTRWERKGSGAPATFEINIDAATKTQNTHGA